VSPILVRPVREQLEHDRIIRLLQTKLKRRHDVAANVGEERINGVKSGAIQVFPDLVLTSQDSGRRVEIVVEVETGESVNHLESMAEWAHFGRLKPAFHLYVPAANVDNARRLVAENHVNVAELWSYHTIGDQTRFTLVERAATGRTAAEPRPRRPNAAQSPRAGRAAARPARKAAAAPASRAKRPAAARHGSSKAGSPAKQKRK
jgi:hypothetical protein